MRLHLASLAALTACLVVAGCSGGGGGEVAPVPSPQVSIQFPPPASEVDAPEVTILGTAEAEGGIAAVSVNGVAATTSDDFAHWQALVPLEPGVNELRVEVASLAGGFSDDASVTVVRQGAHAFTQVLDEQAWSFAFDSTRGRLLGFASVTDPTETLSVDVASGYRELHPGSGASGLTQVPGLGTLYGIAFDPLRQRLLGVASNFLSRTVIRVDPETSSFETLVSAPADVRAIAYDSLHDRLLIFDLTAQAIQAVDLDTQVITEISGPNVGAGPSLLGLGSLSPRILVDTTHDRILFLPFSTGAASQVGWVSIDPATGDRVQVSLSGVQGTLRGVAWDPAGSQLLLLSQASGAGPSDLIGADPQSGAGQLIASDVPAGSWPVMSLAVDPLASRVYFRGPRSFQSVELATGEVSTVSSWSELGGVIASSAALDPERGLVYATAPGSQAGEVILRAHRVSTGEEVASWPASSLPALGNLTRLLWDPVGSRVLIRTDAHVHVLDPELQTISLLSTGPVLNSPTGSLAISRDGTRLWLSDGPRLIEVDLSSGTRTLIYDPPVSATGYWSIHELAADEARDRLICGAPGLVFSYDLSTGVRTILSGGGTGSGPELGSLRGLLVDPETGTIFVSDSTAGGTLAINPSNGARSFVSQAFGQAQLAGFSSDGILLQTRLYVEPGNALFGSGLGQLRIETGEQALIRAPHP